MAIAKISIPLSWLSLWFIQQDVWGKMSTQRQWWWHYVTKSISVSWNYKTVQ